MRPTAMRNIIVCLLASLAVGVMCFTATQRLATPPRIHSAAHGLDLQKKTLVVVRASQESESPAGNIAKLLFILAPFVLGAVDLVAHEKLVAAFSGLH